ncbi:hypothetical protein PS850_05195 [Pseudomonas fluorescens]|nr:hypothetical protein PS850_05195 [Pseudomonas fluorescens]
MSHSDVRADSNRLSCLAAYDAVMGLSSGQTVRWGNLLFKIIESRLLPLVMEAAGRAEGYALGLRDAGVITEIQRGRMASVALAVTADKIHSLPPMRGDMRDLAPGLVASSSAPASP